MMSKRELAWVIAGTLFVVWPVGALGGFGLAVLVKWIAADAMRFAISLYILGIVTGIVVTRGLRQPHTEDSAK